MEKLEMLAEKESLKRAPKSRAFYRIQVRYYKLRLDSAEGSVHRW